jgi:hypothetical protein
LTLFFFLFLFLAFLVSWRFIQFGLIASLRAADNKGKESRRRKIGSRRHARKESDAMVRSVWIAAVVVGLAWTGLAEAQSSAPAGSAIAERYITVREEGKLPQRCKLLKSWREANGVPAFQVQVVDSGELMTIVGSGPPAEGGNPRALSTRIFHWGSDNKPPAGAPLPPTQAAAPSNAAAECADFDRSQAGTPAAAGGRDAARGFDADAAAAGGRSTRALRRDE